MPEVRNCRRCGRIFNYIGGQPICQACKDDDEEDYKKVKEYLYRYPGTSLSQVSQELDIAVEKIKKFLRDGRLEIVGEDLNLFLECEACGKSIRTGRYCEECERDLMRGFRNTANSLNSALEAEARKHNNKGGLRYLNKDNN